MSPLKPKKAVKCPECGKLITPHRACPQCGFYKGKSVKAAKVVAKKTVAVKKIAKTAKTTKAKKATATKTKK